jgi:hypothetical protein
MLNIEGVMNMKYKCPHCGKKTISYKQKILAGYISVKFQYCKECSNRFKYSTVSKVFAGILGLVLGICIVYPKTSRMLPLQFEKSKSSGGMN